ncbi:MAG: leucyl/phenylalanyl-tRNA--protein transferase [Hyphomicrobiales bacterium]|nr:leucyl/phenylalanyl-tRNA--protein transferase [Hyphomicrobiales bacterium]MDE2114912.1 leucyl/phenylalanyl-tRNA--protein transferase [Hyphomicrobiales bacterium]
MSRIQNNLSLTPQILLQAYSVGLFPMAESADDPHIFWVDPPDRGIFPLDGLIIRRSLAKVLRADRFEVRIDHDFDAVIAGCAKTRADGAGTWINPLIRQLYRKLFDQGHVHSVETYLDGALVGGLYGVALGQAFCGESMFHRATDASKVALAHLVAHLRAMDYQLLDTQFITPHLASLGAIEISRNQYHARLDAAVPSGRFEVVDWSNRPAYSGARVLEILSQGPEPQN